MDLPNVSFEKRRDYIFKRLCNIKDLSCVKPIGAFYVFPNVKAFIGQSVNGKVINNDYDLALYLLEDAKVSLMPGSAFGMENYIRISYATSMPKIEEGMNRIEKALYKLRK